MKLRNTHLPSKQVLTCHKMYTTCLDLNISEVSHDTVISVKNDLISRGITNSFDTWHGKQFSVCNTSYTLYTTSFHIVTFFSFALKKLN